MHGTDGEPIMHRFESAFNIGDSVLVTLGGTAIPAYVRAVTFSTGKVRYSVVIDDGSSMTLHNLDSVLVTKGTLTPASFGFDNYAA